jgi:nicotinamide-nucleotide amidase
MGTRAPATGATVVTIGNELLSGAVIDSNSATIAQRLLSIGIPVEQMVTVGDDKVHIEEMVKGLVGISGLAIVTGGLGPTDDDITAETAATALEKELVLDKGSLNHIEEIFNKYGLEMTPNNERQAFIPEGALVVPNPMGTAPGFVVEEMGTVIVFLPGVPRELERMLDDTVVPLLREKRKDRDLYRTRTLKIFGLSEAKMGQTIEGVVEGAKGVCLASLPSYPENRLQITASGKDLEGVDRALAELERRIRERLGVFVFGVDEQSHESVVGDLLRSKGLTLAVAESCTGGLISHRLTNIPGSSDYFKRGIMAYSNEAKEDLLKVPKETIKQHGVVSNEVAEAMAQGVRKTSKTSIGLGVTGIAGPGGGSPQCPVGTVCIALSDEEETLSREYRFWGGRENVKILAASMTIDCIRRHLLGFEMISLQ